MPTYEAIGLLMKELSGQNVIKPTETWFSFFFLKNVLLLFFFIQRRVFVYTVCALYLVCSSCFGIISVVCHTMRNLISCRVFKSFVGVLRVVFHCYVTHVPFVL